MNNMNYFHQMGMNNPRSTNFADMSAPLGFEQQNKRKYGDENNQMNSNKNSSGLSNLSAQNFGGSNFLQQFESPTSQQLQGLQPQMMNMNNNPFYQQLMIYQMQQFMMMKNMIESNAGNSSAKKIKRRRTNYKGISNKLHYG